MNKETHTAYFEDGTTYVFSCATQLRLGWALEEAAKRKTRLVRLS